jgi:hypothetical protein
MSILAIACQSGLSAQSGWPFTKAILAVAVLTFLLATGQLNRFIEAVLNLSMK